MKNKLLVGFILAIVSSSAMAERLIATDGFAGQPVLLMDGGNVNSCGVRFVGVELPLDPTNPKEVIGVADASFMLHRGGYGMVKALLYKTTLGNYTDTSKPPTTETFNTFWMKAPNSEATKPLAGKAVDGDTKGSRIYASQGSAMLDIYGAILEGKSIQIGYKFLDDSKDFAYYGKVSLTEQDLGQVVSCMDELLALIQKDANALDNK